MAVARGQAQSGIQGFAVWMIVFIALWLATTVVAIILYMDFGDMTQQIQALKDENAKLASPGAKRLPAVAMAKPRPGETMVDLIEKARAGTAEVLSGNADDDVATLRSALNAQLVPIRASQYVATPDVFEGTSCLQAASDLFGLFQAEAAARAQAEQGVDQLTAELASVRGAQEAQKQAFDTQAEELRGQMARVGEEAERSLKEHADQIEGFDEQIEKIKQQCSDDIQAQRAEFVALDDRYEDLVTRYRELQDKLGQSRVAPQLLATARGGDGFIIRAEPGRNTLYISLGAEDQVTLGLAFAVYDALEGIPADGRAKGRVEVVEVYANSALCEIKALLDDRLILAGDIIANPVYDRDRQLQFFVLGEFDLDGDRRNDRDGRQRIEVLISNWGGVIADRLGADVDFAVVGKSPSKPMRSSRRGFDKRESDGGAQQAYDAYLEQLATLEMLSVPRMTQSVLLNFLGFEGDAPGAADRGLRLSSAGG